MSLARMNKGRETTREREGRLIVQGRLRYCEHWNRAPSGGPPLLSAGRRAVGAGYPIFRFHGAAR
jgi:hypothetical protein